MVLFVLKKIILKLAAIFIKNYNSKNCRILSSEEEPLLVLKTDIAMNNTVTYNMVGNLDYGHALERIKLKCKWNYCGLNSSSYQQDKKLLHIFIRSF